MKSSESKVGGRATTVRDGSRIREKAAASQLDLLVITGILTSRAFDNGDLPR